MHDKMYIQKYIQNHCRSKHRALGKVLLDDKQIRVLCFPLHNSLISCGMTQLQNKNRHQILKISGNSVSIRHLLYVLLLGKTLQIYVVRPPKNIGQLVTVQPR